MDPGQTIYKAKASSTFMKILQKLARTIVKHDNLIVLESCHGAGVWISSEARPSRINNNSCCCRQIQTS
jgi:hypothetical protein